MNKEDCVDAVKRFRAKHGVDASDENVIATIHLMNTHSADVNAALDQSSRSANDHGIDAWYYHEPNSALFIYQSKLSESKALVLKGLKDLDRGRCWVEQVIIDGSTDSVPDNHCLFNLYTRLSRVRTTIRRVHFELISTFDRNELEDSPEYEQFERDLVASRLNDFIHRQPEGKLFASASEYNLEYGVPQRVKVYEIPKIPEARIDLRKNAHLDVAFVTLHSLIELYRQRGDVLFDKNVRLSLMHNKEARERLLTPMENTLDLITQGNSHATNAALSPPS